MSAFWPLLEGVEGAARFDGSEHRLWLERRWNGSDDYALHIGMNPSVAGADRDDLTIRKDQEFTRRMGLTRLFKCNIGTWISTDPIGLEAPGITVCHPENLAIILGLAHSAARVVVATGNPPDPLLGAARATFRALKTAGVTLECFGLTKDHWPKHSSRLAYKTEIVDFVW